MTSLALIADIVADNGMWGQIGLVVAVVLLGVLAEAMWR